MLSVEYGILRELNDDVRIGYLTSVFVPFPPPWELLWLQYFYLTQPTLIQHVESGRF